MQSFHLALIARCSLIPIASDVQASGAQSEGVSDIDWALSAAPPAIAAEAAVVNTGDDGKVTPLREGRNGWTCIVHDPGTPLGHPLCVDQNGLDWMHAAMSGMAPNLGRTGYSYMLRGGTSFSATDVSMTQMAPGQGDFIRIPPHFMIMNARIAEASGFPLGEAQPDTRKPFVIYGHTPFAILIIPL